MRRTKISTSCLYIFICLPILAFAQKAKDESAVKAIASKVWVSDQGDGIYINPTSTPIIQIQEKAWLRVEVKEGATCQFFTVRMGKNISL